MKAQDSHRIVVSDNHYGGYPTINREFAERFFGPESEWDREEPPDKSHMICDCAPSFV